MLVMIVLTLRVYFFTLTNYSFWLIWLTVELCLNVFILSFSVFQSATEAIQGQDT